MFRPLVLATTIQAEVHATEFKRNQETYMVVTQCGLRSILRLFD